VFEPVDSLLLVWSKFEENILLSEANERASDECVILDEMPIYSTDTKKSANFGDVRRRKPIFNCLDTYGINDSALVGTDMSENVRHRDTDKHFGSAKRCSVGLDSLNNSVNGLEMLPDESANTRVARDSLEGTVGELVSCRRSFDRNIVDEGLGAMGNLRS